MEFQVAKQFESIDEDLKSNDWRAYFDSSCLRVWHLTGKDRTFKITKVTRLTSEMVNDGRAVKFMCDLFQRIGTMELQF